MVRRIQHKPHMTQGTSDGSGRVVPTPDRGIAIFVVILVLTVLTAVGMFAAHISGLNQRTSGYAKQGTQTSYVAQYGVEAVANELGPQKASAILAQMDNPNNRCRANQDIDGGVELTCYRFSASQYQRELAQNGAGSRLFAPDGGSFGPSRYVYPRKGDFIVELFDKGPARPLAGSDQTGTNSMKAMRVTVSSVAQVRPDVPGTPDGGACSSPAQKASVQVSGTRAVRAYIVTPPM